MDKRILDIVSSPADLKLLTNEELSILAQEVREEIITTASETGGHVASSLGAVEIILAVHSMMDCPHDKIVFDVGHQAYAHKLITGRLDEFRTLRTYGGLSGFPKPDESPYDVHPSGHASDSCRWRSAWPRRASCAAATRRSWPSSAMRPCRAAWRSRRSITSAKLRRPW